MSEQLSDKSSSLALPDDLSLDEHSSYQLLVRDSKVLTHTVHTSKRTQTFTVSVKSIRMHCVIVLQHTIVQNNDMKQTAIKNFFLFRFTHQFYYSRFDLTNVCHMAKNIWA